MIDNQLANLSSNALYEINSPPHGHAPGVFVMLLRPPAVVAKHANTHTICRSVMYFVKSNTNVPMGASECCLALTAQTQVISGS